MISSNALLDTILSTLGRDDGLRRAYLRRRWQGLADARSQPGARRPPLAASRCPISSAKSGNGVPTTRAEDRRA
jgi:hypothetical protein